MKSKFVACLALISSGGLFGCVSSRSTVTVIDAATGKPVAGAQVMVVTPSLVSKSFITDRHGTAGLGNIEISSTGFGVHVSKSGYWQTSQGIWGVVTNHLEVELQPEQKP